MNNCSQYPTYNTQGQLVSKSMHQVLSDVFMRCLDSEAPNREQRVGPSYNPTCCSDISTQDVAARVVDIKYYNSNACFVERNPASNKHRVG